MIAGSICAVLLVIGWSVALISYLVQRMQKKTRTKKVAAGIKLPNKPLPQLPRKYIIPPDPAVVLGQRQPGEHVTVESKRKRSKHAVHSRHIPEAWFLNGDAGELPEGSRVSNGGQLLHSNTELDSRHQENTDDHPLANGNIP